MALLNKLSSKPKSIQDDSDHSNPDEPESIHFPTKMEEYEFEGRIGRGAFASVYVARMKSSNLRVAIKCIELELTKQGDDDENKKDDENDISWDEIQKEAAIMARMHHQNVVTCHTSFCVATELWFDSSFVL